MAGYRCRLCGGRLSGGKCLLCGLDNSIYDRERLWQETAVRQEERKGKTPRTPVTYETSSGAKKRDLGTNSHKSAQHSRVQTDASYRKSAAHAAVQPKPLRATRQKRSAGSASGIRFSTGRRGGIMAVVIAGIVLISFLPGVIESGESIFSEPDAPDFLVDDDIYYYDDSGLEDYEELFSEEDLYEYVTREIPEEGEYQELILENGFYTVGTDIPEGVYRADLVEGSGVLNVTDDENGIYMGTYFDEDDDVNGVISQTDIRLYNGAAIEIDSGVILKLTTANAQPMP